MAHNVPAATGLAANLRALHRARTIAVCGILGDKDIAGITAVLGAEIDAWILVALEGPRAVSPAELEQHLPAGASDPCARCRTSPPVADWRAMRRSPANESSCSAPSSPWDRRSSSLARIPLGYSSPMDSRAKQRLTGAVILVALFVLLVPELLRGPRVADVPEEPRPTRVCAATPSISMRRLRPRSPIFRSAQPAVALPPVSEERAKPGDEAAPANPEPASTAPAVTARVEPPKPADVTPAVPRQAAPTQACRRKPPHRSQRQRPLPRREAASSCSSAPSAAARTPIAWSAT